MSFLRGMLLAGRLPVLADGWLLRPGLVPDNGAVTASARLLGRLAVIFSPLVVSCALASHDTLECEGYARQDAARIAINVLLYSLHE